MVRKIGGGGVAYLKYLSKSVVITFRVHQSNLSSKFRFVSVTPDVQVLIDAIGAKPI